jgi:hypothetical protein
VVSIIAAIAVWATRSSSDFVSSSQTGMAVVAMIIGVCALVSLGLMRWNPAWALPIKLAGLAAVALGAWGIWSVKNVFRARATLPLVDSTGASMMAAAAVLAAVAAVVLGMSTAAFIRHADGRMVLCAFFIVAIAVPALIYRQVGDYRATVWHPDLTAAASPPAPLPDAIGRVRYRLALDDRSRSDIYAAGNGFIVLTYDGVTAYDGPTGAVRWRATSGRIQGVEVVWRDRDDTAGIVVLLLDDALIAVDGSSGDVMWRRQYSGELTAATGSVDALAITVFDADALTDRTQLYSFDPSTGELRWSRPISCSNPTPASGTPGKFSFQCGPTSSVIDAHTGKTTDMPGMQYRNPRAGDDVYVSSTSDANRDGPQASDATFVIDPDGRIIDQIPGSYPMSRAANGFLLLYGTGETWLLRDYRKHQSTVVPIHIDRQYGLEDIQTAWLKNSLAFTTEERDHPLLLIDPARPAANPSTIGAPCPHDSRLRDLQAVAGAVLAKCRWTQVAGMVP